MNPKVSILIPCYNAGPWIRECIESALAQTYAHKEIIVLDDGSSDNSLEIIRSFGQRIRFEAGPNRGGNAARNRLLHLAEGEWLSYLDADDYLLPNKIEKQIASIRAKPGADVVHGPVLQLFGDGSLEEAAAFVDHDVYANFFRWSYFTTSVLLLKKSAVTAVGGWNEDQMVCQEHELILRIMTAGKEFTCLPLSLAVYRTQHQNSVSRRSPVNTFCHRMALTDRLEAYLKAKGELTEKRRVAMQQASFLAARAVYPHDKVLARAFCAKALAGEGFVPPAGVNEKYLFLFKTFGFDVAEQTGRFWREVIRKYAPRPDAIFAPSGVVAASPKT